MIWKVVGCEVVETLKLCKWRLSWGTWGKLRRHTLYEPEMWAPRFISQRDCHREAQEHGNKAGHCSGKGHVQEHRFRESTLFCISWASALAFPCALGTFRELNSACCENYSHNPQFFCSLRGGGSGFKSPLQRRSKWYTYTHVHACIYNIPICASACICIDALWKNTQETYFTCLSPRREAGGKKGVRIYLFWYLCTCLYVQ